MPNRNIPAYLALGIGVLALSFSAMFVRWADAPGPVTAFYRMFFSIPMLAPFVLRQGAAGSAVRSKALVFPLMAGVFTALDLALWTTALFYTTAANATLLGNTAPLWVALGAWLILKQKLTGKFWQGLVVTLAGAVLIMGTDFILHPRFGVGDVMAAFTGFFYGGYFLFTEKSRVHFNPILHIWIVGIGAGLTLFLINAILGNPLTGYDTRTWIVFLSTALVSQLIGYMALAYALGHLPASIVAPTMVLQPVVTAILAIPLLGEVPNVWQGIGGMTALVGIYMVNQSHRQGSGEAPNS